jgi:tRNA(His) 5'-end guanylyltransferase
MKFEELEKRLRIFEAAHDQVVLPGITMVARLDGRNFTRLTRETHPFEAPYDERFRDLMVATVKHLMAECGFRVVYGYTQSDEISLLFHPQEEAFARKLRKLNSILAGEASAKFSLLLGQLAAFDCRIVQLPRHADVVDYFRWRSEDAHRNALNGHCYWALRGAGQSVGQATARLAGLSVADKNELLFQAGINFNDLPLWQKRGAGVYWETYEKLGWDPLAEVEVAAQRRRLKVDFELPMRDQYSAFIRRFLPAAKGP